MQEVRSRRVNVTPKQPDRYHMLKQWHEGAWWYVSHDFKLYRNYWMAKRYTLEDAKGLLSDKRKICKIIAGSGQIIDV